MRVDGKTPVQPEYKAQAPKQESKTTKKPKKGEVVKKKTIHNIYILDVSGSMREQNKYKSSIAGVQAELELLVKDTNVDYLNTVIEFSSSYSAGGDIRYKQRTTPLTVESIKDIQFGEASGGTPLYNTVGKVLTDFKAIVKDDEYVVVKIFTDGGDTDMGAGTWSLKNLPALIKECKEKLNWTITFNCTEADKPHVLRMEIENSNIMTHDNTFAGITKMSKTRGAATVSYAASVAEGVAKSELVSNFYSKSVD